MSAYKIGMGLVITIRSASDNTIINNIVLDIQKMEPIFQPFLIGNETLFLIETSPINLSTLSFGEYAGFGNAFKDEDYEKLKKYLARKQQQH